MEKGTLPQGLVTPALAAAATPAVTTRTNDDWRRQLPELVGPRLALREIDLADAPALLSLLNAPEVTRFIANPPGTVEAFQRFIDWTRHERSLGRYAGFAVVPHGTTRPIGLFQLRQMEPGFTTAEWGFALGSAYWGTGFFAEAARMVVDFAVETVGVHRLEARAAAVNGRGNGALRKMGAVQEGVLRQGFCKDGRQMDQTLWSILAEDWRRCQTFWGLGQVH